MGLATGRLQTGISDNRQECHLLNYIIIFNDRLFVVEGCLPCECNVGGSVGANCNQLTGQCTCVLGTTGTHCDQYV